MRALRDYTIEEVQAMRDATDAEGDVNGVLYLNDVLDAKEADAYATSEEAETQ